MAKTKIEYSSVLTADLVKSSASDEDVLKAAWVSTGQDNRLDEADEKRRAGLINYLTKKRHGSPFEHSHFTFYVEAPIFVFREFMRHRIASYNEESGRYQEMTPKFYVTPRGRAIVQEGSGAHPKLVAGSREQLKLAVDAEKAAGKFTWELYQAQLDAGIAKEVAREVLPLNIYSRMYVTMNARALMNFLSLRIDSKHAMFETKPQWEIDQVAREMEKAFAEAMPLTYKAFVENGRVAP